MRFRRKRGDVDEIKEVRLTGKKGEADKAREITVAN